MKPTNKKNNILLNAIIGILLAALWFNVFFIHKTIGIVSWWLLHILGIVGVIILSTVLLFFVKDVIKKKKIAISKVITLVLAAVMTFPVCWFFGAFQMAYPARLDKSSPSVSIRLPFNEEVLVGWGGDSIDTNYPHAVVPAERWAYDLLMKPAMVKSEKLEDYGIYDKEVVAPISGTVVAAYDGEEDITPGTDDFISQEGNYIYIRIDETGTYLLMNHLKQGSVLVKNGDHIIEGAVIGRVGNSGSTSEPHLHIHHQRQDPTKTSMFLAEGLPLYFRDINGNPMPTGGMKTVTSGKVPSGEFISPK